MLFLKRRFFKPHTTINKGVQMASKFSDPFVQVGMEEVKVGGQSVPKVGVMIKDDDGKKQCVGILGKDYNLIKNQVAHDTAHDVMSRSKWKWQELKSMWNGRMYIAHYITQKSIINENDIPLHAGIMVRNAYDGTGCFGFEMFACNLHCTNQYISRNRFGFFAIRHTGKNEFDIDDALQNVQVGADKLLEVAPVIHSLRKTPLSLPGIIEAKKNTQIPQSKWGDVLDQLAKEEQNHFGLFQAMTYVTTHILTGFTAITIGDGVTEWMLKGKEEA
jgi:hypothetical protein